MYCTLRFGAKRSKHHGTQFVFNLISQRLNMIIWYGATDYAKISWDFREICVMISTKIDVPNKNLDNEKKIKVSET